MKRSEQKHTQWLRRIQVWQASGQTRSEYCAAHDLKLSTLDYWRRRCVVVTKARAVRHRESPVPLTLVPVTVAGSGSPWIEVGCVNGAQLKIPMGVSASWLAELVCGMSAC